MRPFILLVVFVIVSCSSHEDDQAKHVAKSDPGAALESTEEILIADTLVQNGDSLIQFRKGDRPRSLITISGDTIVPAADYYQSVTFPDIDEDEYNDIQLAVFSNTPNQAENYLFDKKSRHYKRIQNSHLDIVKLTAADLFYSYNRAGCADMIWESHLSEIKNWREVNIGRIVGKGCGDGDDGIYTYKLRDGKATLIEKLRIDSVLKNQNDKWAFIKRYWATNYRRFQE